MHISKDELAEKGRPRPPTTVGTNGPVTGGKGPPAGSTFGARPGLGPGKAPLGGALALCRKTLIPLSLALDLARTRIKRCGVLPYVVHEGRVWFLWAVDKKTGELTDFGGGIKEWETALEGGLREYREESRGVFSQISLNDAVDKLCLFDPRIGMAIIFFPFQPFWIEAAEELFELDLVSGRAVRRWEDEVSAVRWVEERELTALLEKDEVHTLCERHRRPVPRTGFSTLPRRNYSRYTVGRFRPPEAEATDEPEETRSADRTLSCRRFPGLALAPRPKGYADEAPATRSVGRIWRRVSNFLKRGYSDDLLTLLKTAYPHTVW